MFSATLATVSTISPSLKPPARARARSASERPPRWTTMLRPSPCARSGSKRKGCSRRWPARALRHRLVVDNRHMTENPALLIEYAYPTITLRAPLGEQIIIGKAGRRLRRMVGGLAMKHELAWSG